MSGIKRLLIALLFFFTVPFVHAGIYNNIKNLNTINTEHFRIYFTTEDEDYAFDIRSKCEKALDYVNELFDINWKPRHLPIVITRDVRKTNPYESPENSYYILLHNNLINSSDILLSEDSQYSMLVYQITRNMLLSNKSASKDFLSMIVGDVFDNSFFINLAVVEGISVMAESSFSQGRANNTFAMNNILQGIRTDKLYNYYRASGAIQKYPSYKVSYNFFGAFFGYIYNIYGKDKFSSLIKKLSREYSFRSLFKKIYGISIDTAYENFLVGFKFPNVIESQNLINESSRYSNLVKTSNGLYFYDSVASIIYRFNENGINDFFTAENIIRFDFSHNRKYFAIHCNEIDKPYIDIYMIDDSDVISPEIRYNDVSDFAFVDSEYGDLLALYYYDGKDRSVDFVSLDNKKVIGRHILSHNEEWYNLCQYKKNKIIFFRKNALNYDLCVYDIKENLYQIIKDSYDCLKYNLSYDVDSDVLTFSYVDKTLRFDSPNYPRCAIVKTDSNDNFIFNFQNENIDGGVLNPILMGDELVFKSENFVDDNIMIAKISDMTFSVTKGVVEDINMDISRDEGQSGVVDKTSYWLTSSKNPIDIIYHDDIEVSKYYPVSKSVPFTNKGYFTFDLMNFRDKSSIGFQYLTKDITEQYSSILAGEFAFGEKKHISASYEHILSTRFLSISLKFQPFIKFDDSVTTNKLHIDYITALSIFWKKLFKNEYNFFNARMNLLYDFPRYESNNYVEDGVKFVFNLAYSDLKKQGYGFKNSMGYDFDLEFSISDTNKHFKDSSMLFFPSFLMSFNYYTPSLTHTQNPRDFTISLPTTFSLKTYYKYSPYQKNSKTSDNIFIASLSANTTLFSIDLSEKFIDNPCIISALSIEFMPRIKYANYTKYSSENGVSKNGFMVDFNLYAYIRVSPTFLGFYVTSSSMEIGININVLQKNPAEGFSIVPMLYLRMNEKLIYGIDGDNLENEL